LVTQRRSPPTLIAGSQLAAHPVEQREIQRFLELGDGAAHRRLRDAEQLGSARGGAADHHGAEGFELSKVHGVLPDPITQMHGPVPAGQLYFYFATALSEARRGKQTIRPAIGSHFGVFACGIDPVSAHIRNFHVSRRQGWCW
jgi:hypothetical protein